MDFDSLNPDYFDISKENEVLDEELSNLFAPSPARFPQTPCSRESTVAGTDRSIREVLESVPTSHFKKISFIFEYVFLCLFFV